MVVPIRVVLWCAVLGVWGIANVAFAVDGYELFGIGPIQKGMGGAGAAAPKDATWVLLNPASIVDLDRRLARRSHRAVPQLVHGGAQSGRFLPAVESR